jgi:hypothetical protein
MKFDADQIRRTLAAIFHEQGDGEAGGMLDVAKPSISHANSDFGQNYYSLDLRIPVPLWAKLEPRLQKIEDRIAGKLPRLGISSENDYVNAANIFVDPPVGAGAVSMRTPTKTDESRIWATSYIRVFISHLTRIKGSASELKQALLPLGVECFVAHEDIEPTAAWHQEIEFALNSMDALCAIVTPDFIQSPWTDQEVGFGLGRNVPVIAVKAGHAPYGLLGKHQALIVDIGKPESAASAIFDVLAKQESLHSRLVESLVSACAGAMSFQSAKGATKKVAALKAALSDGQVLRLLGSIGTNSQLRGAHGVPETIQGIAKARGVSLPKPKAKASGDFDDDIPF